MDSLDTACGERALLPDRRGETRAWRALPRPGVRFARRRMPGAARLFIPER